MTWKVYVIHFSRRFKHAAHYTGIAKDVEARHAEHTAYRGSRLIAAALMAGVRMSDARVIGEFPDYSTAHAEERRLKNLGGARRICPICKRREAVQDALKRGTQIHRIIEFATLAGWTFLCQQANPPMISFTRSGSRINVYYTKMTVGTCINHPTKGKTQLFRRNVGMKALERIFNNPRVHTSAGYYKRGSYERKAQYKS